MNLYDLVCGRIHEFDELRQAVTGNKLPCLTVGLAGVHKALFAFGLIKAVGKRMLIITPDELSARKMCDDINSMAGEQTAYFYPSRELVFRNMESMSDEYEQIRLGVLARAVQNEISVCIASADAAAQYTIPPEIMLAHSFIFSVGQTVSFEQTVEIFENAGYVRRPQIDGVSQYSVRGGIIDFFPPQEKNPVRVEFWGDDIDSISYFDLDTQRRTDSIESIRVVPASEILIGTPAQAAGKIEAMLDGSKKKSAESLRKDIDTLKNGIALGSYDKYIKTAYGEKLTSLFDYFEDALLITCERSDCIERINNFYNRFAEDLKILLEDGEISENQCDYYLDKGKVESVISSGICFEAFTRSAPGLKLKSLINVNAFSGSSWSGELGMLKEELNASVETGYACAVLTATKKSALTLASDLSSDGIDAVYCDNADKLVPGRVYVMEGGLSSGFEFPSAKFMLMTNQAAKPLKINRSKRRKGEEIKSLSDIHAGDLVVHVSHGIGIFDGINKLDVHGVVKDYIKIKYAGSDTLFVPVTQLDLVSKYIGPRDDGRVKLNKLNSGEWQKTRRRVKQAVAEMADELIRLYAERMNTKGYAFSEDDEFQRQFEEHFPYDETEDQLRCAEEIKQDMQKPSPMDRLLCADVGFGKTEVALRAAFKCVLDGKQCAILCPTTILAWQHYQNIIRRMDGFPINIELLSRFRTAKQQKQTIKGLKNGTVDLVVGTHRLVQKDIEFKDLGLAIIDEEQRFGVRHKEKFKELFAGVDVLTLSATPIPRTLNMAMSGIRDMSTIEEPPQDRLPVQTYVLEYDIGVISEALQREIRRGGQAYYIHNRIESIELCASKLRERCPGARIGIAHGKMGEEELSEIWRQLVEHEIDILVCTTLIETGVDVANCNTLIIEDADNMGLAQLYQLRGRVGRSSRRAYAYFTFRRGKALSEIAAKRLSAIREFTKFGSGFRIALRDLEIRGAGSILGAKQHGHMEAVGYDMYVRLLSEAINEQKGEKPDISSDECLVDIRLDAHIPEDYISNLSQRLDVYRKIASVKTEEDELDMTDELIDRFGEPPESVKGLIDVAMLRNTAAQNGFNEISEKSDAVIFKQENFSMDTAELLVKSLRGRVSLNASGQPYISVRKLEKQTALDVIRDVVNVLKK